MLRGGGCPQKRGLRSVLFRARGTRRARAGTGNRALSYGASVPPAPTSPVAAAPRSGPAAGRASWPVRSGCGPPGSRWPVPRATPSSRASSVSGGAISRVRSRRLSPNRPTSGGHSRQRRAFSSQQRAKSVGCCQLRCQNEFLGRFVSFLIRASMLTLLEYMTEFKRATKPLGHGAPRVMISFPTS